MRGLFPIFLKPALLMWLKYAAIGVFSVVLFDNFFGHLSLFLVAFNLVGMMLYFVSCRVDQNVSWLMSIPVSKRGLVVFNYVTGFLNFIFFLLFSGGSSFLIIYILRHQELFRAVEELLKWHRTGTPVYEWWMPLAVIIPLVLFHSLLILIGDKSVASRRPGFLSAFIGSLDKRKKNIFRICLLLLTVVSIRNIDFFSTGIVIVSFITLFPLLFSTATAMNTVSMPKHMSRVFILSSAAFGLAIVAASYLLASNHIVRLDRGEQGGGGRANALLFLGPFSGKLDRENIAKALSEDRLDPDSVQKLARLYIRKFEPSGKIRASSDGTGPSFRKMIHAFWNKERVVKMFDHSTLGAADVNAALGVAGYTARDELSVIYGLLDVPLTSLELETMLGMKPGLHARYVLARMRFQRSPIHLASVMKSFSSLEDGDKIEALKTISVLSGRKVTLSDWKDNWRVLGRGSAFSGIDCSSVLPGLYQTIDKAGSSRVFNSCIREQLLKQYPLKGESADGLKIVADSDVEYMKKQLSVYFRK